MNVGENIRRIREQNGVTQAWLSDQAGISQPTLCQIERGTKNPSLQVSAYIARALNCSIESLLGMEES